MKKITQTLLILTLILSIQSCSKTSGCQDPNAENFNADANEDCNCCEYEGSVVFWYGKTSSEELIDFGSKSLTYYLDGQIVGSSAANVFFTGAPNCGQNSSVTVTKKLGAAKSKSYSYKVVDQDNDVIWEDVVNIDANTCLKLELTF
jgi:hypothetical protein